VARALEDVVMANAFAPEYQLEILELLRSQRQLRGVSTFGVRYETGFARLSGSPETSPFNTLLNAFVAYCALRQTPSERTGSLHTMEEAWEALGVYGGDDGLTADADQAVYSSTAQAVGQVLTCEVKQRGEMGVKFLARQYGPDVWYGDTTTMCDVKRTLSKFHLTVTMPNNVTKEDKLVDKAHALWLTDANTPIVGEFVSQVMLMRPGGYQFTNRSNNWNAQWALDVQYPNEYAEWMEEMVERQLADFDQLAFRGWLEETRGITALLTPPLCLPREEVVVKTPVVLDGELVLPEGMTSTAALIDMDDPLKVVGNATVLVAQDQGLPMSSPGNNSVPAEPKIAEKVATIAATQSKQAALAKKVLPKQTLKAKLARPRKPKAERPSRVEKTAPAVTSGAAPKRNDTPHPNPRAKGQDAKV
jgi:hypothetical protein